jgi:hypothetical protein
MRYLIVAGTIGVLVGMAAAQPDAVTRVFDQFYPRDAGKREALDRCTARDSAFNRLDAAERDACYVHNMAVAVETSPAANFVDFWRAAGQGHLQQTDVRFEQQTERYLRAAAAEHRP